MSFPIIITRKQSLGQGNKFTGVCLSTGGGVPDQFTGRGVPDQFTGGSPWAGTPPEQTRPPGRHAPPGQTHPPGTK